LRANEFITLFSTYFSTWREVMQAENVWINLRELMESGLAPKPFVKWLKLYLETIAIDPAVCECLLDPSCAVGIHEMLTELLKLENYAIDSKLEPERFVKKLGKCLEILGAMEELS